MSKRTSKVSKGENAPHKGAIDKHPARAIVNPHFAAPKGPPPYELSPTVTLCHHSSLSLHIYPRLTRNNTVAVSHSKPPKPNSSTTAAMSSQAYTGYQPQQSGGAQDSSTAAVDSNARTVHYKCGDCDQDVPLKRGEPIRCRNCGHRVLYKQRTNR